ncbi:MAG: flagellar protein FliS [Lachnospiraceae bacterium]
MKEKEKKEYTLRIAKANKTKLIVILYDMVCTYLEEAMEIFDEKEFEHAKREIKQAILCLEELQNSLQLEFELAKNLHELYLFYKKELIFSYTQKDKVRLEKIYNLVKKLRDAYSEIEHLDESPALMENTQNIYTGYTYGKSQLNVDLADQNTNRGFFV